MSSESVPITAARFAEAIKDLPLSSLVLKVRELRHNIAHLVYSNEQLQPFAEGTQAALGASTTTEAPQPDQDCIDAIRENEVVIGRMQERIRLVQMEVESRGVSWAEFLDKEAADAEERAAAAAATATAPLTNGVNGHASESDDDEDEGEDGVTEEATATAEGRGGGTTQARAREREPHPAWSDGTFQTGTIRGGEVHFNDVASAVGRSSGSGGGSLTDEELRRRLEQQLGDLAVDDTEGGLHL
ncbi:hypothetical protein VTK73DRAFT_2073 [Phialemonium thermophilum]|uniref:Uncharacterized protein n=1 Tax=Phialemonium thermophilum TaxID=223376 RepID=A0ABR3VSN3_9PEZI